MAVSSAVMALRAGAELLCRIAEVLDLGVGLGAALELLALAVDPDHRHLALDQGRDVGRVPGGDVDPALLAADAALGLLEVGVVGLVAAHLLRGDDEVELGAQVAPRDPEQLVVDVGDDADVVALSETVHRRVRFAKRGPALDAVGQELRPRGLQLPADLGCDLDRGPAQDLGVELVRARHDLRLDLEKALDQGALVDREPVLGRMRGEGIADPLLPVDQGAVAVSGHPIDLFQLRQGHRRRGIIGTAPGPPTGDRLADLMDLLEYQGKEVFARHGVAVPSGRHAATVDDAAEAAEEIGYPCVIKAQVKIGKRGKAGGIKIAKDSDEARTHSEAILGMDIRGFTVHDLWIESASEIDAEYYA